MEEGKHPPSTPALRALPLLALALLVAGFIGLFVARDLEPRRRTAQPVRPPSVLFILVDTLRADYLGAYGFEGDISPRFDGLAARGVLFENAISQAPWTKPSIASLFTSLYPEQHGVTDHEGRFAPNGEVEKGASALPSRAITIAESFRDAGYDTAAFVANPWVRRRLGFAQGFRHFDVRNVGNIVPASLIFEKFLRWFSARKSDAPFFAYIHLMDAHGPYRVEPEDYAALSQSASLGPQHRLTRKELAGIQRYLFSLGGPRGDPGTREAWRTSYAAGVRAFDRALGGFLDTLAAEAIEDDFILIVTSDHGEELVDHGAWGHGDELYEEQLWVPLLIVPPGRPVEGRRVERVVSLIDVMPTLLAMSGIDAPAGISGQDLGPLLRGEDLEGEARAFASGVKRRPDMKMVRTQGEKLVRDQRPGSVRLFDLSEDPGERHNLAGSDAAGLAQLEALLAQHRDLVATNQLRKEAATLPPEVRDKLRALGYLQDEESEAGNSLPAHSDQENEP